MSSEIFKLIRNTIYTYIVDIENTGRTWSDMEISRQICGVLGYQQNENLMVQYIVEAKMKLWEATTIEGFEERIVPFRRHEDCEYKDSLSILLSAQRKRVYRVDLNQINETDLQRYIDTFKSSTMVPSDILLPLTEIENDDIQIPVNGDTNIH